ncbi:hypothetical protein CH063_02869, partial [Colletotrichum higginsianum]
KPKYWSAIIVLSRDSVCVCASVCQARHEQTICNSSLRLTSVHVSVSVSNASSCSLLLQPPPARQQHDLQQTGLIVPWKGRDG